jgi:tRNA(fMet)-specific endonuclease VapC
MSHLIDTNIAIALRDNDDAVMSRVQQLIGDLKLSIISHVELMNGLYRDVALVSVRQPRVTELLRAFEVLDFDDKSAAAYTDIIAVCGYSRKKMLDRMIAAQALVYDLELITLNGADFNDIPKLKLQCWSMGA